MSYEPVDFYVVDQNQSPVEGVLIKVFNQAGSLVYSETTTDSAGLASLLLPTNDYSARFYKQHVSFSQPQLFTVLAAPSTNVFDVVATVYEPPTPTDPRLCKATGYFRSVTGAPHAYLDMHFQGNFDQFIVDGDGVVDCKDIVRTDKDGFVCVNLYRGAEYMVIMECLEDCPRLIKVPDAPNVNLADLLFPVVANVVFDPVGPFTILGVGEAYDLEITPSVYDSTGRLLEGTSVTNVTWKVEDESIAVVTVGTDTLTLRGIAAGTTNLTAERLDKSIVKIPDSGISGQPIGITVL